MQADFIEYRQLESALGNARSMRALILRQTSTHLIKDL